MRRDLVHDHCASVLVRIMSGQVFLAVVKPSINNDPSLLVNVAKSGRVISRHDNGSQDSPGEKGLCGYTQ